MARGDALNDAVRLLERGLIDDVAAVLGARRVGRWTGGVTAHYRPEL